MSDDVETKTEVKLLAREFLIATIVGLALVCFLSLFPFRSLKAVYAGL